MNNLITPDELIVSFKRNGYQEYRTTNSHNFQYSVFGCLPAEWAAFQNIHEVASRFKMVEFLSGSLTLYFFNNLNYTRVSEVSGTPLAYQSPVTIFIAYQTARRWMPEGGPSGIQQEILFPDITDKLSAWESTSELPGVSGKFISNSGGAKPIQKLKWKFTQRSWNTLKADPTGFQCELDQNGDLSPTGQPFYPFNNGIVKIGFNFAGATGLGVTGGLEMYGSHRLLLRFKGRRE